jgi:HK97 gp10 family phage protein
MRVAKWSTKEADMQIQVNAMDRLQEVAEAIAEEARRHVPVGQNVPAGKGKWSAREAGALKRSIRVVRLHGDPKKNVRVYAGSREVYYARFVEYGTAKMRARPFLRPAVQAMKSKIGKVFQGGS